MNPWTKENLFTIESELVRQMLKKADAKLHWTSKVVHGHRRMTWIEFLNLCDLNEIDVTRVFFKLGHHGVEKNLLADQKRFVLFLTRGLPFGAFKRIIGWSENKIPRLKNGTTPLRFVDVLAILSHTEFSLYEFLLCFLPKDFIELKFPVFKCLLHHANDLKKNILLKVLREITVIDGIECRENLESLGSHALHLTKGQVARLIDFWIDQGVFSIQGGKVVCELVDQTHQIDDEMITEARMFIEKHLTNSKHTYSIQSLVINKRGLGEIAMAVKSFQFKLKSIQLLHSTNADQLVFVESAFVRIDTSRVDL